MIELTLFGSIDLRRADGTEVDAILQRPRAVALLAYLGGATLRPGTFHRRDLLLDLFWRDSGPDQSRTSLRQIIHFIRSALGELAIEGRGDDEIRLPPHVVRCDVADFDRAVADGDYARADEFYRGDLLPGFNLPESPAFEQWLMGRRITLAETAADVALKLAERSEDDQNLTDASRYAQRAAQLSMFDERKFRRAVQHMVRAGNGAKSILLYEEMCRRLEEHGTRPSPETRKLMDEIRRR